MTIERIDGCIGCGTCVSTCPMVVSRMDENGRRSEIRRADDGDMQLIKHPIRRG